MERLLTVEQAAKRLQSAPYTVRKHLREGRLRGIKRGRDWRVPESALLESSPPAKASSDDVNSLARALALVEQLEREMRPFTPRIAGVNDAATEIRRMREERTP